MPHFLTMTKMTKNIISEDSYFVSIKDPVESRRHILEASKKCLQSLQSYQKILLIRDEKLREMEVLRESVKELIFLNTKLGHKLPQYKSEIIGQFKREEKKSETKQEKKPVKAEPKREEHYDRTELQKLEESLNAIEEKLKTLG